MIDRMETDILAQTDEAEAEEALRRIQERRAERQKAETPEPTRATPKTEGGEKAGPLGVLKSVAVLETGLQQNVRREAVKGAPKVAEGLSETPGAVAHGAIDGVNATIQAIDEVAESLGRLTNFNPTFATFKDEDGQRQFRFTVTQKAREDVLEEGREATGNEEFGDLPNLPQIAPEQNTAIGNIVEGMSQFFTGFAGGGRVLKGANILQKGGKATAVGRAATQGLIADFTAFDGHEESFAEMLTSFNPELEQSVLGLLTAEEETPELIARVQNSLEGLGLGLATDALVRGVRAIRSIRGTKAAAQIGPDSGAFEESVRIKADKVKADMTDLLGDPKGPTFAHPDPDVPGDPKLYMRNALARMDTGDDIRKVAQELLGDNLDTVDAARRGTVDFARQRLNSSQLNAWKLLEDRGTGGAFNAEELRAVRGLWAESADRVHKAAQALAENQNTATYAAYSQAVETHRIIQAEVMGARAEAGRALGSLRDPVGGGQYLDQVETILTEKGGRGSILEDAKRIAGLSEDQVDILDGAIRRSALERTSDAFGEWWRFSLLSNPKTHIVNAVGNTSVMAWDIAETYATGRLGQLLGNDEAAEMVAEAASKAAGLKAGFRAQMKYLHEAGQAAADRAKYAGNNALGQADARLRGMRFNNMGAVADQIDTKRGLNAGTFGTNSDTILGAAADAVGAVLRIPGKALGAADDFFKGVNYMSEIHGQAHRVATAEVRAGILDREDIAARIADLVDDPSESMRAAARSAAEERTFTTPAREGGLTESFHHFRKRVPIAGQIVFPFINTPANILKYTLRRSPAGVIMGSVQERIAMGGKEAALAKSQMAIGTALIAIGIDYAADGTVTGVGPSDRAERETLSRGGWMPNAVRINGKYHDINRMDPLSAPLIIGASLHEIFANQDIDEDNDIIESSMEAVATVGNMYLSKTFLTGAADAMAVLNDPERYAPTYAQRILGSLMVPAGVAEARRFEDPAVRDVQSVLDAIRNRLPMMGRDVPQQYDLWGRPKLYSSGYGKAYDALVPFSARTINQEPIDEEMVRLKYYKASPNRTISVDVGGLGSINVSLRSRPDIYQRYVQLSGNETKVFPGGLGARDYLNSMIETPDYQRLADGSEPLPGSKAAFIASIVDFSRKAAREELKREFGPELAELAEKKANRIREEREQEAADAALSQIVEAATAQ